MKAAAVAPTPAPLRLGLRCAVAAALVPMALAPAAAQDARRSSFDAMSPATQAMQRDDGANPAWLWKLDGERRFAADCARCHTPVSMAGVAARFPAWDAHAGRVLTLGAKIADCHARRVAPGAAPLAPESDARLALEVFIGQASRGRPIAPPDDARVARVAEQGRQLFERRIGQLDLACTQCHDRLAGRSLAGSPIPQGHPTGYPIYRLEWQAVGSLQRRLRGCMTGVRAEPYAADGPEMTALETFLMRRAAGLPLETPAVRP